MATPSELSSIAEVVELQAGPTYLGGKTDHVNAYLSAGWALLATYTNGDMRTGQDQVYCLGWPRERGDVVRPAKAEDETRAF